MRCKNHLLAIGALLSVALTMILPGSTRADDSSSISSKPATSGDPPDPPARRKADTYRRLLNEIAVERKHIEDLEKEVQALQNSNVQLKQTTTNLQSSNQQLSSQVSQTTKLVSDVQKGLYSQYGPSGFADRINAMIGAHTFTMVGGVSVGFYYDRQSAMNQPVLDFEVNPMIRLNDWIQFYSSFGATVSPGGISDMGPSLANLQIFPFGQKAPLELVGGLFDLPLGDWYEDQSPNWINPFITAPLPFGAEAVAPPSSLGMQARGGVQWGQVGQDVDYTLWIDSGPSFESSPGVGTIPGPVIGEAFNPLTGTNIATNGKGIGARFRWFPIPIDMNLGRLELEASTYNGKWLDGNWYNSWDVGYAYRVGPFRTRGEWVQSYREMPTASEIPSITGTPSYPGCCGHDNRQGWFTQFGYFLYGIPHPDLGDWLEPRFDKTEFSVRYSGVNQAAILANDITDVPVFGFNGSKSVFSPHAREVALALDYWIAPSIVWQNEVDFELPRAGGTLYNLVGGALPPVPSRIGATTNDIAVMSQLAIGF